MPETSKQIQVGEGGGDTRLYVLTATGTVDDQATISVAGQSYTSPSGAGVRINGSFSGIKAGFYTVSVSHINIDYPPRGNVSFLNCTVGPASAISITPDENDPPQECDCDCPPCSCNSDGETTPGGVPSSSSAPVSGRSSLRHFFSNLTTTSGGSGVMRQSSVNGMAWSARGRWLADAAGPNLPGRINPGRKSGGLKFPDVPPACGICRGTRRTALTRPCH